MPGRRGAASPEASQEKQTSSGRLGSFVKEESRQETNQNALASRAMLEDLSPEDQNILKELSRVEYDLDHGLDRSYENVLQNQLLRDSYRKSLDVHGIRGKDLEDMVRYVQKQQKEQEEALDQKKREARKQVDQTLKNSWRKDQQAMLEDLSPEDQNILKELSRVEYDLDHGLDRSYENVLQNQLLRDSYRKSLDVHGIRGKDLEDMVRYVQKQQKEQEERLDQKRREDKKRAEETWSKNGEVDVRAMMDDISAEDLAAIKALNQAQYHLANDNLDRSYENISRNQALAESYLKTLANHGIEGKNLQEMLWMLDMQRDEQLDENGKQERRDFVDGGYWQGLGSSGLGLLEKALGRTANAMDIAYQMYEREKIDSKFPLNDHVLSNRLINRAEAGQQEAGDKIEQWGTEITGNEMGGDFARGVYDGIMNTGDILLSALLGAKVGTVINALSEFSDSFWQAKDQGAADDSAFNYALLSQIPQIFLDRMSMENIANILSQKADASQDMLSKIWESIKYTVAGEGVDQVLNNALETYILSDASRLEKVYDEAYQKAIDEGADIAEAQNAGRIAQMKELVTNIGIGALENIQGENIGELFKQIFKKSE